MSALETHQDKAMGNEPLQLEWLEWIDTESDGC